MEEGSGNGAPERPEAPASVVSGGGTGLCRTAGPPLRGISTRPFPCLFLTLPQPPALSLGGRLFLGRGGKIGGRPPQSGALAPGSRGSAHRHLLPGLPVNQVKGWGTGRGLASKGSDFLPLILLFDHPPPERLIYRNQSFHRDRLTGFCCCQDA